MKRLIPFAAALLLVGCGSKDALPYLGRWHGEFIVDKIGQDGSTKDKKRESLRGSLQIYATEQRIKLHLEGEQEAVDADGTWSRQGTTVTLKFSKLKIDDEGGKEHRDPNLKFIPSEDLDAAYQRDLVLHLSRDKQRLVGLEVSIGNLVGHYLFTRSTD